MPESWSACGELLPHALAVASFVTDPGDLAGELVRLLNSCALYLTRAADRSEAARLAGSTLAQAEALLGPDDLELLIARQRLATAYFWTDRFDEAIAIEERVLADRERLLGPSHLDTVHARADLAESYFERGRTEEAIRLQESVVRERDAQLPRYDVSRLSARHNLARMCCRGGNPEGVAHALADLEEVCTELPPGTPNTLRLVNALGDTYVALGRHEQAIETYQRVCAERERILPADHPDVLASRAKLADAYREAGQADEHRRAQKVVYHDRRRVLGEQHPETVVALRELDGA